MGCEIEVDAANFRSVNTVSARPGRHRSWRSMLGPALLATGALHVAYGVAIAAEPVGVLVRLGIVFAAPIDPATEGWFWFMIAGVPLLLVGHLVGWAQRRTGDVPRFVAPYLGVLACTALLYPISGLWLFFPLAIAAGVAAGSAPRPAPATGSAAPS